MAEDHGRFNDEVAYSSLDVEMHIRTADSSLLYGDKHIVVGFESRNWLLFESDLEWLVQNEGELANRVSNFNESILMAESFPITLRILNCSSIETVGSSFPKRE